MDVPSETNSSNDNPHWSKDRLHADANRAVGGALNLIRETSRISQQLDGRFSAERLVKRILFMSYELQSQTRSLALDCGDGGKLAVLNEYFFVANGFRCVALNTSLPARSAPSPPGIRCADPCFPLCLASVLETRTGAPLVIELLYAFLAERIGVSLEFVDLKPTCFLKWTENGSSRFIDVTRHGATLSSDQLIETLHTRFSLTSFHQTSVLDTYTFESYISDYLLALKSVVDRAYEPEKLLFLQDTLISYQPSNLQLVGERALLHRRLGNFKNALADLKRYFAFHERSKAPVDLVALFDEMMQTLERAKSKIEVLE